MDLDLGEDIVYRVSYKGEKYDLEEPSAIQMSKFQKQVAESSDQGLTAFIDLIVKMGMPQDVAETLSISKLKMIVDNVLGNLTEKK